MLPLARRSSCSSASTRSRCSTASSRRVDALDRPRRGRSCRLPSRADASGDARRRPTRGGDDARRCSAQAATTFADAVDRLVRARPRCSSCVGGALLLLVGRRSLTPSRWPRGVYAVVHGRHRRGVAHRAGVLAVARRPATTGPTSRRSAARSASTASRCSSPSSSASPSSSPRCSPTTTCAARASTGPSSTCSMLLSASGGVVMASANDLIVLFLGLETCRSPLYVLAGHATCAGVESQEAGIKYFVLGGFSSAFFLYGIALVYGATGSTNLATIADFLADNVLHRQRAAARRHRAAARRPRLQGRGRAVPHAGRPTCTRARRRPVTGFMASAAKAAAFAALLRVFVVALRRPTATTGSRSIWVLAVLTLLVGSVLAVVQTDVKRMLAYSSISHAGFILVGVQAAHARRASPAALFYLLAYTFMVLGAFGVVAARRPARATAATTLDDFRGLSRRRARCSRSRSPCSCSPRPACRSPPASSPSST